MRPGRVSRRLSLVLSWVGPWLLGGCAGTAPTTNAVFFPPPPGTPRLQYLTQFTSSRDVVPARGAFAGFVLGQEETVDEVVKPYGVAMSAGRIYVCDTKRNLVNVFDLGGRRFGYLGFEGPGRLAKPINVTVADDGTKYVADAERGEIVIFSNEDRFLGTLGSAELAKPVDVAVGPDRIWVCDAESCEIVVFGRSSHELLTRFGSCGSGDDQFARPTNVALGPDGNLYVSDTINGRVRKVDPDGRALQTFGSLGSLPGQFARPKGVSLDAAGRLYVVDAAFENVQIFDPSGQLLLAFGGAGPAAGNLNLPAQVVVDYDDVDRFRDYAAPGFDLEYVVLVTSQYGPRKVSVFGFGRSSGDGS
ncbi:MAG: hypothetical protein R3B81_03560 [bacterium]